MAAHLLPDTPPLLVVNIATAGDIPALQGQPIEWLNPNPNKVHVVVTASGAYPLQQNDFWIPGILDPKNTLRNDVLSACPVNSYAYVSGINEGSGKLIIRANRPRK
jgi:hypothetical protein